jgi:membrane protease YdiL (CAAX protease family)
MLAERSNPQRLALPALLSPVVVVLGIAAMLAVANPAARFGIRPALFVSELFLAAPGLLALVLFGIPLAGGLALVPIRRRSAWLSLAAGGSLWVLSLGLFELQYTLWRPPEGYLESFRRLHAALRPADPLDAMVSVAAIAVAPAACEEVLFRGIVLASLLPALGRAGSLVLAALLFGLIHLDSAAGALSFYRVPFAVTVGLGLGALRLRSQSLLPPTLAHAALNAITFLAAPLADDPSAGLPDPRPGFGAAMFAAGLAGSALVLRLFAPPEAANEARRP